ncbi:hypothetical protein GWK47_019862 [Chionoecetes opilio]|uniref:Uncharacterized protein n=1 Tax=Chionoecetes opilio TaxID=41210 RepID=A0A8J4XRX2_CHIOP|nr:hypothetical protein GWK47_019862 [Chionoecetes opilio]
MRREYLCLDYSDTASRCILSLTSPLPGCLAPPSSALTLPVKGQRRQQCGATQTLDPVAGPFTWRSPAGNPRRLCGRIYGRPQNLMKKIYRLDLHSHSMPRIMPKKTRGNHFCINNLHQADYGMATSVSQGRKFLFPRPCLGIVTEDVTFKANSSLRGKKLPKNMIERNRTARKTSNTLKRREEDLVLEACHLVTRLSGGAFNSLHLIAALYTLCVHLLDVRDSGP